MAIEKWKDKQMVIYLCNGVLLSNRKEWTIDTHSNLNELQNDFTKWKKPGKIEFVLYDSILWSSRKWKQIYRDIKQISSYLDGRWGTGHEETSEGWQIRSIMNAVMVSQVRTYVAVIKLYAWYL